MGLKYKKFFKYRCCREELQSVEAVWKCREDLIRNGVWFICIQGHCEKLIGVKSHEKKNACWERPVDG